MKTIEENKVIKVFSNPRKKTRKKKSPTFDQALMNLGVNVSWKG
ncbi:MAG: hypothetical protein ACI9XP_002132 [Lentimonas sp.]|jgi:hypothetical protein